MKAEGAKATASDGATEIHTLVGVGLVVSAFAFNRVVAERDALKAENERLTNCLKKANDQAEDFERRWYLADMELERIKALPPVAEVKLNMTGGNAGLSTHIVQLAEGYFPAGTKLYALGSKP